MILATETGDKIATTRAGGGTESPVETTTDRAAAGKMWEAGRVTKVAGAADTAHTSGTKGARENETVRRRGHGHSHQTSGSGGDETNHRDMTIECEIQEVVGNIADIEGEGIILATGKVVEVTGTETMNSDATGDDTQTAKMGPTETGKLSNQQGGVDHCPTRLHRLPWRKEASRPSHPRSSPTGA